METTPTFSKDLIWLCFVNYVKTYEDAGEMPPADESTASNGSKTART